MSNIQKQMFEAIDIIAKQRISEIKLDTTIEAYITDNSKLDIGEYKARYQDIDITVFSNSQIEKYAIGDNVFILVPQGDFGRKKTILGSSLNKGEEYIDLDKINGNIDKVGYNFVDEDEDFVITLPTKVSEGEVYTSTFRLKEEDMITYYPRKKVIIFGMILKTNIDIDDIGDYGIAIEARFVDDSGKDSVEVFKTKITDIVGNPYKSDGYKEIIIPLPAEKRITSVIRGYAYVKGFKLGTEENTISLSELNIQYGTAKDIEDESGYSANLLAPKGLIFRNGGAFPEEKLHLAMEVKKYGSVLDNSDVSYLWFEIDEDIKNSNQDGYYPEAGYGWRQLEADTEGLTGVGGRVLEIEARYIPNFSSFKCIAKYKDFLVISNVVTLTDQTDSMTTEIISSNGYAFKNGTGSTTLTVDIRNKGEEVDKKDLLFKWIKIAEDGQQIVLRFNEIESLPVDISSIGNRSTFICEIYRNNSRDITITKGASTLVVVFDAPTYGLVITEGFRAVLYDKDGRVPQGFTPTPFKYTLFKKGEPVLTNLTQKWTIPRTTATMLTMPGGTSETDGSKSTNAKDLTLGIDNNFSQDKMNNVVKLTVTHTEGDSTETFIEYATVSMTKVGDSGADGPAGTQGVDGNSYVYEIQNGTRVISYDQNGLVPTPKETEEFSFVFYKNGADVTDEIDSITWTVPKNSLIEFKNPETYNRLITTAKAHKVTLVAKPSWSEENFNNILKVEFVYNNIKFREYCPIIINKNAKDGEKGEDGVPGDSAYTVLLSNDNHTFPASKDGALLSGSIKTSILAMKGASPISFKVGRLPTSDNFNITILNNVITIQTKEETIPRDNSGSFSFQIEIEGKTFLKDFSWSLAKRGNNGESAKYVVLGGDQIFTCGPGYTAPYQPSGITITSASYGIEKKERQWYYRRAGEQTYYSIPRETKDSIVIYPDNYEMWKSATSISLKCVVDGYSDEITVAKVANGAQGSSSYSINLSSSNGLIFRGDRIDTVITATIVKDAKEVTTNPEVLSKIFWERIDSNGKATSTIDNTFSPEYFGGVKNKIKVNETSSKVTFNCGLLE